MLWIRFVLLSIISAGLFFLCLLYGTVSIPASDVVSALISGGHVNLIWDTIIFGSRLPAACTAALSCAALAVSGLMMQTAFDNPLAGPSVLGVSTGASLGVAIVMLAFGGSIGIAGGYVAIIVSAIVGATVVMSVLLAFSRVVRNSAVLLIVGLMVGYLASSAVSLLNFFSTQEGVHSFVIWGMGTFNGVVTPHRLSIFTIVVVALLIAAWLLVKPLDAMMLGESYAANLGVNVVKARNSILFVSGTLAAVVTAFCGPIGFIGLVVPHIAHYIIGTGRHLVLLPASALCGAGVGLFTLWISCIPSSGIIPISAITPIIGVPVIIYLLLRRHD